MKSVMNSLLRGDTTSTLTLKYCSVVFVLGMKFSPSFSILGNNFS